MLVSSRSAGFHVQSYLGKMLGPAASAGFPSKLMPGKWCNVQPPSGVPSSVDSPYVQHGLSALPISALAQVLSKAGLTGLDGPCVHTYKSLLKR
jgi:hypothetical protein